MGKVATGLSMSLDGFIAGPNDGPHSPLGDGGERQRHDRRRSPVGVEADAEAEALMSGDERRASLVLPEGVGITQLA
jgi:hypothetical protein